METKLEKCKEVALDYLHSEIYPTKIPFLAIHPFFESTVFPYKDGLVNINENEDAKKEVIAKYEQKIKEVKDIITIFIGMRNQYRMQYFSHIKQWLSEKDFGNLLAYSWVNDENANNNSVVDIEDILDYFKKAQKIYLMNEEELEKYKKLPQKVTIYRGVTDHNRDNDKVLSWTLSKKQAEWFAHRFDEDGDVIEKEVDRKYIYAYFNSRDEDEVIVDYHATI